MNKNVLAVYEEVTEDKIVEYLDSLGTTVNLQPNEKKDFINIAREFRLNPFKREIYITAYGKGEYRKYSIITGYEVYIKRAERTGKLDGWNIRCEGEGKSLKAIVEIYRKDYKYPFSHEVYYSECCQHNGNGQPNATWAKMPRFMTKKVAISQAFRLCFPDDLGGIPHDEAEMPEEEKEPKEPRNVTPPPTDKAKKPVRNKWDKMGEAIGEIVHALNPDGLPYFTESEANQERAIAMGASNFKVLENQYERLKNTLKKRQAEFEPIPFEIMPSMYQEKEPESPPLTAEEEERISVIGEIDTILKSIDESGKPYFTTAELKRERENIEPTASTAQLKISLDDLQKELKKRQHAFKDDIPWQTNQPEIPIF